LDATKGQIGLKEKASEKRKAKKQKPKEATMSGEGGSRDRRRYGVIETRFQKVAGMSMYNLTINGELWSCVEWSPSRRAWCIQDASGRCLAHYDAIHGQDVDAQTALALARRMILDGRMPTPEDAHKQLNERLEHDRLGEPWELLRDPVTVRRAKS
jgi:hypothetical protein